LVEELGKHWAIVLGVNFHTQFLLDTKPVPVVGYKRSKLNSIRERVEGAFNEVQNTGRNLERLLRKTVIGLITHVIAKMASHTLKLVLRRFFGIDVQTFEMAPA